MEVTDKLAFDVFRWLDIPFEVSSGDYIQLPTVCHHGDSHKLYYYRNTHRLVCFTNCGGMDIFELVAKIKNISNGQAFKMVVSNFEDSPTQSQPIEEDIGSLFLQQDEPNEIDLPKFDDQVLNHFYNFNLADWKRENISFRTQDKFEIMYSIEDNAIIIPHRDIDGNLVGIRQRNLDDKSLDMGIKYIPTKIGNQSFKFPTGANLYGYYFNKKEINNIKKIVLFEAEKSVLMMDTFYEDNNYSVALSGHNLTRSQLKIIEDSDVEEIIVALDKDFREDDIETKQALQELIIKKFSSLSNRFNVSVLWDNDNLLGFKDSPTDKGKEVFEQLMQQRRYLIWYY